MQLTYAQRMELIEIVKKEAHDQFMICHEIDNKFKGHNPSMQNDKREYWMTEQDKAYKRWDMLISIRNELQESV